MAVRALLVTDCTYGFEVVLATAGHGNTGMMSVIAIYRQLHTQN
jgi:hypothetical protein